MKRASGESSVDFYRSGIVTERAGHAAAPTFIDDTAYRPSSVMAYAMPPSPRGRLSSEGSAHFCDIRPYTPSVALGDSVAEV